MAKLKWVVSEVPTGRYRSFDRRAWPSAEYVSNGRPAVLLDCDDEYIPAHVKTGNHKPIIIRVAFYHSIEELAAKGAFTWKRLKAVGATLSEAKAIAEDFITRYESVINVPVDISK